MVFVSPCNCRTEALISMKELDICLLMGRSEWIPSFPSIVSSVVTLLKLSLHRVMSFLTFALPILSPSPLGGGPNQAAVWVLICWPGSTYHSGPSGSKSILTCWDHSGAVIPLLEMWSYGVMLRGRANSVRSSCLC